MGPLSGVKVIEFAGIGPAPFCAMLLSDLGAKVTRIDRLDQAGRGSRREVVNRGRRSIALNLKSERGRSLALRLIEDADVLLEGFRPGVMERLGLGPSACLEANPGLIFGRMTGWGQHGPLAATAGHDINYIALSGALHALGEADRPPEPPLNLVGDYGGGAMFLALGVLAALLESRKSGQGQVVDAAMTDGSAMLMSLFYGMFNSGSWRNQRQSNFIDGAAPFYRSYQCADGRYLAVGSLEPQFYQLLLEKCGISDPVFLERDDPGNWAELSAKFADIFRTRSRDEWCKIFEGTDACVAPVLDLEEAPEHEHNRARKTFVPAGKGWQPAPAPRFSRSETSVQSPPPLVGEHSEQVLRELGMTDNEVRELRNAGEIPPHPSTQESLT